MTRFDAQIDDLGAQLGDLVLGLDDIGAKSVEFGAQRFDRRLAPGDVRPQSHGDLLGGAAALLLATQAGAQVGVGSSIGLRGHELLDLRLPPVGPLQPQDADGVDQLGERAGRDRRAERLVAVDGTSKSSERTRGNPRLARHGSDLARDRDRRPPFGDLVTHQDRVLDGTAQVAVLDRSRIGHEPTILDLPASRTGVLDNVRMFVLTCVRCLHVRSPSSPTSGRSTISEPRCTT